MRFWIVTGHNKLYLLEGLAFQANGGIRCRKTTFNGTVSRDPERRTP